MESDTPKAEIDWEKRWIELCEAAKSSDIQYLDTRITFSCAFTCPQGEPSAEFTKHLKTNVEAQLFKNLKQAYKDYDQNLLKQEHLDPINDIRSAERIGHHFSPKTQCLRIFINMHTYKDVIPHLQKMVEDPKVLTYEYNNQSYRMTIQTTKDRNEQQAIIKGIDTGPRALTESRRTVIPAIFEVMKARKWLSQEATLNKMEPREHTRAGEEYIKHTQEWIISYTDLRTVPNYVFAMESPYFPDEPCPLAIIPIKQRGMEAKDDPRPTLVDYESKGRYASALTANILQEVDQEPGPSTIRRKSPRTLHEEAGRGDSDTPKQGPTEADAIQTESNNQLGLLMEATPQKLHGKHVKAINKWQKTVGRVGKLSPKKGKHILETLPAHYNDVTLKVAQAVGSPTPSPKKGKHSMTVPQSELKHPSVEEVQDQDDPQQENQLGAPCNDTAYFPSEEAMDEDNLQTIGHNEMPAPLSPGERESDGPQEINME